MHQNAATHASYWTSPLTPYISICYNYKSAARGYPRSRTLLSSSMAEHSAVNRRVVGSSPTSGANQNQQLRATKSDLENTQKYRLYPFLCPRSFKTDAVSIATVLSWLPDCHLQNRLAAPRFDRIPLLFQSPSAPNATAPSQRTKEEVIWRSLSEVECGGTSSTSPANRSASHPSQRRRRSRKTLSNSGEGTRDWIPQYQRGSPAPYSISQGCHRRISDRL